MTNDENRMTKECPKSECSNGAWKLPARTVRYLGIESFFRHSGLGISHSFQVACRRARCILEPALSVGKPFRLRQGKAAGAAWALINSAKSRNSPRFKSDTAQ